MRKLKLAWLFLLCGLPTYGQHSVVLHWTASTDAVTYPSLGYNVYRLTTACPTGTPTGATKLNATPVSAVTYTDSTVQVGTNCYYVTSTVNGMESAASNLVAGSPSPAPPTALTVTVN